MKKIFTLVIVLSMVLAMAACGDKDKNSLPIKAGNMKIAEAELTTEESRMLELVSNGNLTSSIFDYTLDSSIKQGTLSYCELNDKGKWEEANLVSKWACGENASRIYIGYDSSLVGEKQITISSSAGIVRVEQDAKENTSSMGSSTSVLKKPADIKNGVAIPLMIVIASDDDQLNGADIGAYGDTKKLLELKDNDRLFAILVTFSDKLDD